MEANMYTKPRQLVRVDFSLSWRVDSRIPNQMLQQINTAAIDWNMFSQTGCWLCKINRFLSFIIHAGYARNEGKCSKTVVWERQSSSSLWNTHPIINVDHKTSAYLYHEFLTTIRWFNVVPWPLSLIMYLGLVGPASVSFSPVSVSVSPVSVTVSPVSVPVSQVSVSISPMSVSVSPMSISESPMSVYFSPVSVSVSPERQC